jgi:hypothetical protein
MPESDGRGWHEHAGQSCAGPWVLGRVAMMPGVCFQRRWRSSSPVLTTAAWMEGARERHARVWRGANEHPDVETAVLAGEVAYESESNAAACTSGNDGAACPRASHAAASGQGNDVALSTSRNEGVPVVSENDGLMMGSGHDVGASVSVCADGASATLNASAARMAWKPEGEWETVTAVLVSENPDVQRLDERAGVGRTSESAYRAAVCLLSLGAQADESKANVHEGPTEPVAVEYASECVVIWARSEN